MTIWHEQSRLKVSPLDFAADYCWTESCCQFCIYTKYIIVFCWTESKMSAELISAKLTEQEWNILLAFTYLPDQKCLLIWPIDVRWFKESKERKDLSCNIRLQTEILCIQFPQSVTSWGKIDLNIWKVGLMRGATPRGIEEINRSYYIKC